MQHSLKRSTASTPHYLCRLYTGQTKSFSKLNTATPTLKQPDHPGDSGIQVMGDLVALAFIAGSFALLGALITGFAKL